jgi:hypothetical protein
MRSQPDVTGSDKSRTAWPSTPVCKNRLLTAWASSVVGGVWRG